MIELRFHSELYSGDAVDAAVKVYEGYGTFELEKAEHGFVVRMTANDGVDERTLADELGNYALGATIEERSARMSAASSPETDAGGEDAR